CKINSPRRRTRIREGRVRVSSPPPWGVKTSEVSKTSEVFTPPAPLLLGARGEELGPPFAPIHIPRKEGDAVKMTRLVPALLALASLAPPAAATDLTKIDRTVGKEPAYQTKSPRYCLLVFGPEAKARVWLVLDGDTLYVDRNGNGDLTEEGESVALPAFKNERKDGMS